MQTQFVHDPLDSLVVHMVFLIQKFLVYPTDTVIAIIFKENFFDFLCQFGIPFFHNIGFPYFKIISRPGHSHCL